MISTEIPSFCIVGQANQGKTTLLATLTENDKLRISNMPGTTTDATEYPVEVSGKKIMSFWDTPGFENSAEVHDWFQHHDEASHTPARDFIERFQKENEFRAECEILRPIANGAVVIFIVDSSLRIREFDKQQLAILRQCGNPRLAVIYSKDGKARHQNEWIRLLNKDFNMRVEFNAQKANVIERFRLLDKIKTIIPEWEEKMDNAIKALKKDHERRRSEAIGHLLAMLRNILKQRESRELDGDLEHSEIHRILQDKIRISIRKEEQRFRDKTRKTWGHSNDHWKMDELLTEDLFAKNVWKVLGMTRNQLTVVGAMAGAITGTIIDATLLGTSLMLGTAAGTIVGGVSAYMSADRVAMVSIPKWFFLPRLFRGKKLGGAQAIARVDPRSALFGILIDRGMLYLLQVIDRPHGLDDNTPTKISEAPTAVAETNDTEFPEEEVDAGSEDGEKTSQPIRKGLSRTWSKSELKKLGTFLGHAAQDSPDAIKLDEAKANLKRVMIEQFQILSSTSANCGNQIANTRTHSDRDEE